jgi:hypothetical protein
MRLIGIDPENTIHVDQNVPVDPSWKSVLVSARMRIAPGFKPGKNATGVTFAFRGADDKTVGGFQPALDLRESTNNQWVEREVTVRVPSGAKRLYLQCVIAYTTGTIDFDDVQVRGLK